MARSRRAHAAPGTGFQGKQKAWSESKEISSLKFALSVQGGLLRWFSRQRRDLPWRRDREPYRIWVSEVMLQQTQVAAVIPYFERFVKKFPSIASLAAADEAEVLRLWEGLGYYRRARHLHQAAQAVMARHAGQVPRDPRVLASLPGIGRYSMGAILSQAFDQRLPILEANSQRVLCRLLGRKGDPRRAPLRPWLWKTAGALLPRRNVGEFNQALMELGALVCTPQRPRCFTCPLRRVCRAAKLGITQSIPARTEKPRTVHVRELAVIIRKRDRVLLVRRPQVGRWVGLWEFPHVQVGNGERREQEAARQVQSLTGLSIQFEDEVTTLRHSVTHHRITLSCRQARHRAGRYHSSYYSRHVWLLPTQIASYPMSAPQRRLAQWLLQSEKKSRTD
jgi:A/G-specific adenine glycosylase